jgi:hypothetical protein
VKPIKRLIHAVATGVFLLIAWADPDEEEGESIEVDDFEREAAYLTTGLITAVRAINAAHEAGEDCQSHHEAAGGLLVSIHSPLIAIRIIQHLLDIVAQTVDDDDVLKMVATIVATELGQEEEEEDPFHHH